MNIRPLNDRIVVERIEQEEKTAGGIIIPDSAKKKPKQARVLAVGPGMRDDQGNRQPIDIQTNDIVLFTEWAGSEIEVDGKELLVLKESDVIGILEEKGATKKAA